jgi:hypothetical protein
MPGLKKPRSHAVGWGGRTLCVERGRDAPREPGCRRGPALGRPRSPGRGPAAVRETHREMSVARCVSPLAGPRSRTRRGGPVPCAPPARRVIFQHGTHCGRYNSGPGRRFISTAYDCVKRKTPTADDPGGSSSRAGVKHKQNLIMLWAHRVRCGEWCVNGQRRALRRRRSAWLSQAHWSNAPSSAAPNTNSQPQARIRFGEPCIDPSL